MDILEGGINARRFLPKVITNVTVESKDVILELAFGMWKTGQPNNVLYNGNHKNFVRETCTCFTNLNFRKC